MSKIRNRLIIILLILSGIITSEAQALVNHKLKISLNPDAGTLFVEDVVTLLDTAQDKPDRYFFSLRSIFSPRTLTPGVIITRTGESDKTGQHASFRVVLPQGKRQFTLQYGGKITNTDVRPPVNAQKEVLSVSGHISPEGTYLDASIAWFPVFENELVSFTLEAEVPAGWTAISQGTRTEQANLNGNTIVRWEESHPQEDIYVIAGPYHEYHRKFGTIDAYVFLHEADPALAEQYLKATNRYISLYSALLGPYPYGKFALVENIYETGFGMPSFTLLGPQVIRLPFIIDSSFPHEILHNWWGNSVFVDYDKGNWSEGLTAYLADHLMKEQAGMGPEHRRDALERYTHFVTTQRDFPLSKFTSRHNTLTQAIGYDKSLMLFHMLRLKLGDKNFITALREFYRTEQFHRADWDMLLGSFERTFNISLRAQYEKLLHHIGEPSLRINSSLAKRHGDEYTLKTVIEQTQEGDAFELDVPVAVQLDGHDMAYQTTLHISKKMQNFELNLPARPWRLLVDPHFDVFRRLSAEELPATLNAALSADMLLIVLPSDSKPVLREAYRKMAQNWAADNPGIAITTDDKMSSLPDNKVIWLMGWENRHLSAMMPQTHPQLSLNPEGVRIENQNLTRKEHAVLITSRQHKRNGPVRVWLGCDNAAAFAGLIRKIPHYGKYSYLAFQGDEPVNILKGQWRLEDSPLNIAIEQWDNAQAPNLPLRYVQRPALITSKQTE